MVYNAVVTIKFETIQLTGGDIDVNVDKQVPLNQRIVTSVTVDSIKRSFKVETENRSSWVPNYASKQNNRTNGQCNFSRIANFHV